MSKKPTQDERIANIVGGDDVMVDAGSLSKWRSHLESNLALPVEVTGIEDFRWEERYVIGPGDPSEYAKLKKSRPSYSDKYELLSIEPAADFQWAMFSEDLGARVKRKSDKREFVLGLAELRVTKKKTKEYDLLDDYAVWFVNFR